MGVGAGLYMYDVVVEKFTFAISSSDEFLFHVCCGNVWSKCCNFCRSNGRSRTVYFRLSTSWSTGRFNNRQVTGRVESQKFRPVPSLGRVFSARQMISAVRSWLHKCDCVPVWLACALAVATDTWKCACAAYRTSVSGARRGCRRSRTSRSLALAIHAVNNGLFHHCML